MIKINELKEEILNAPFDELQEMYIEQLFDVIRTAQQLRYEYDLSQAEPDDESLKRLFA